MTSKRYRQGDVLLVLVTESTPPLKLVERSARIVLVEGEVSGHAHVLESDEPITLYEEGPGAEIVELPVAARLTHQEHKQLNLPPGLYRVIRQREYMPSVGVVPVRGQRVPHRKPFRWRDLMCGEVRREQIGKKLTLSGWADTRRDHGGLVFIDLRDRAGVCQLVINPERSPEAFALTHEIRNEFVLRAEGEVVARDPEAVNPKLPTGEIELQVDKLEIVSRCPPLPFQLDEENVDETLRLRNRWLDLRRDRLQRNIALRAQMIGVIRRVMEQAGFFDIQTPILGKPTPEGARDFLVPARLQPGRFYALPQSPQLYKQILMIAGFDRYYQIAPCFRDEDLRADRVQEFYQLDVEVAFPDLDELLHADGADDRGGLARVPRSRARRFPSSAWTGARR